VLAENGRLEAAISFLRNLNLLPATDYADSADTTAQGAVR
jgi:hypothetical protein